MKDQIKLLNRLSRILDFDDFYSIQIRESRLYLQGYYTSQKAEKYQKICKRRFVINELGHANIYRNSINIVLL
jgi:hypothetical protein